MSTLLGRPPGLAEGIKGSRMAHSWSERSLAYGFSEVITSSLSTSFPLNYSYSIIFPASDFASSALSPGLFVQPLVSLLASCKLGHEAVDFQAVILARVFLLPWLRKRNFSENDQGKDPLINRVITKKSTASCQNLQTLSPD